MLLNRFSGFLAGLAMTLAAAPASHAQDGKWDLSNTHAGQVYVESLSTTCGGSLVGADLVLTAAHCIIPAGSSAPMDPRDLHFTLRRNDGPATVYAVSDIATNPEFVREETPTRDHIARDIAMLRLAEMIPGGSDDMAAADPEQPYVALLPSEEDAPFAGKPCEASYESNGIMVLACARAEGASGSPVYSLVDGKRKIVGVISANGMRDNEPVTFAVNPLEQLAKMQWISKTRANPEAY